MCISLLNNGREHILFKCTQSVDEGWLDPGFKASLNTFPRAETHWDQVVWPPTTLETIPKCFSTKCLVLANLRYSMGLRGRSDRKD